jgi:hypothetical protein
MLRVLAGGPLVRYKFAETRSQHQPSGIFGVPVLQTPGQAPSPPAVASSSLGAAARSIASHRGVRAVVILWVVGYVAVIWLANGILPFDRPAIAGLPFVIQLAMPTIGMVEIVILMGLVFLLTRSRAIPDMAARAPDRGKAVRETIGVLSYAALGQVGGWILGPALGYRPFSFHIAGTVFGCTTPPAPGEVCLWAMYNFLVFAVVPYAYFRRRYSNTELNLRSTDRRNDARLIIVVLVVESVVELATFGNNILRLSLRQAFLGAPLTFVIFFIGTVLPTMVLIYSILLPRYLRLTGSAISAVLLGGLTYAAMHIVEGWSLFDSPRHVALSLALVLFQYFGPGMIKAVLTLRTGNAWVHAVSYHAIAPHVLVDTPLMVKVFHVG